MVEEQKYNYKLNPFYRYKGFVNKVVDGDTVDVILDLGFGLAKSVRLRIDDYDAPESWRPRNEAEKEHGEAAKARAKELLEGKEAVFTTSKAIGVYGRYGASITLSDGRLYKDIMISEGFSKRDRY